jgi:hypothetical protein
MAVHYINMNPVGAGFFHGGDFLAQSAAVGGKDRWGNYFHLLFSPQFTYEIKYTKVQPLSITGIYTNCYAGYPYLL